MLWHVNVPWDLVLIQFMFNSYKIEAKAQWPVLYTRYSLMHWFRSWLCVKLATSHYLNQWWQFMVLLWCADLMCLWLSLTHSSFWLMCYCIIMNLFLNCVEIVSKLFKSLLVMPYTSIIWDLISIENMRSSQWQTCLLSLVYIYNIGYHGLHSVSFQNIH